MPRENTVLCAHCGNTCLANENANIAGLPLSQLLPCYQLDLPGCASIVNIDTDTDDGEPLHGTDKPEDIDVSTNRTADKQMENEDIMMQDPDMDEDYDVFEAGDVADDNVDEDSISG